jgi:hypothetical protein
MLSTTSSTNSEFDQFITIFFFFKLVLNIKQKVELQEEKLRQFFEYWLRICDRELENQIINDAEVLYNQVMTSHSHSRSSSSSKPLMHSRTKQAKRNLASHSGCRSTFQPTSELLSLPTNSANRWSTSQTPSNAKPSSSLQSTMLSRWSFKWTLRNQLSS